jgi:hypothetical protein
LLANRDLESCLDHAGKVALHGVGGHACHRNPLTATNLSSSQGDLEYSRTRLSVLIKRLVEVSKTEKQDRVRMLGLER